MNNNPSILYSLIPSLFYLAIFFLVFGQKRRSPTRTSFLFCSGFYFTTTFLEFLSRLNLSLPYVKTISHLMLLSFVVLSASFVYFGYSVIHKKIDKVFYFIISIHVICILYSIVPNTLVFEYNSNGGYYYTSPSKMTSLVLSITTVIPAFYVICLMFIKFRSTNSDKDRKILKVILIGVTLSILYGLFIIAIIPNIFPQLSYFHRFSSISTLIFLFSTYYAINKYLFLTINYDEIEMVSKNLFINLKEGVVIIGKFGGVIQTNKAAKDIFEEDINIKVLTEKLSDYSINNNYLNESREISLRNGNVKHLKITQTEIENYDDKKMTFGKLLILTDITNEVLMHKERIELEDQLRHADKMRAIGQLAGGVAHDFNNQLAGIIGCADIIHDETKESDFLHNITHDIMSAAKRAGSLTDQLLAFARKGKYLSKELDLHKVINDTVSFLNRSIDKKIVLKTELEASNSFVTGDPYQLHNALLNIALNSRDAIDEKSGFIKFKTSNSNDGNWIILEISDNGCGIPSSIKNKIFEPFFTTKDIGKGTGMGLAAVYGIVINHNGKISFDSSKAKGTKFSVELNTITTNLQISQKNDTVCTSKNNIPENMKQKILVIDDEQIVCKSTQIILETIGYQVNSFTSPIKALDFFKQNKNNIDIVILDIIMPKIDGYEMFYTMKKLSKSVKVILSSGYSLDEKTQALLDNGANSFIQKPFDKSEILKHLEMINT